MNAAVLVDGYAEGGRKRARAQLEEFWFAVSGHGEVFNPLEHIPFANLFHQWGLDWWTKLNPWEALSRQFSPYELNPMNYNPLRDLLHEMINCHNMSKSPIKLFVTATNVETGQPKIFSGHEIGVDSLLASGCLPFLFQSEMIDGVPYWDGGYTGNPSLWPLYYRSDCEDILLVQINPLQRPGAPKNAMNIIDRLNEITFNASLIDEMRAINFVKKLIARGKLEASEYADVRMHMVAPPSTLQGMEASSKTVVDWDFFCTLRDAGRAEMEAWLGKHKSAIGRRATIDIAKDFLAAPKHADATHATMNPSWREG
ncbi:MAG: patatin-like phospholipase family protein [Alphaproteobacteria bacterium]